MQRIIVSEKYTLSLELLGEKIRLILFEDDVKLVCRKETVNNLRSFLLKDKVNFFKGRLQLNKDNDIIEVIVKDKPVAIILANKIELMLNNLLHTID